VAAALILGGGAVHFKLYLDDYGGSGSDVARSFLVNAIASLVVAVLLVVWRHPLALVAGLVLVNATLLGFALSRTSWGIFDFSERGFIPSPEAVLSLVFEIGAAVVLLGLLVVEWAGARREVAPAR
jgi:hypothetical protein